MNTSQDLCCTLQVISPFPLIFISYHNILTGIIVTVSSFNLLLTCVLPDGASVVVSVVVAAVVAVVVVVVVVVVIFVVVGPTVVSEKCMKVIKK